MKFTFTNKETYLKYRSDWKTKYKKLSQQIREKKWMLKEYSRACIIAKPATNTGYDYYGRYYGRIAMELQSNAEYCELEKTHGRNGFYYLPLQMEATEMISELKAAKAEAQRQYLTSKNN